MLLDLELEAEFDAQAFAKGGPDALRALFAKIRDGRTYVLVHAVSWDYNKTAREAFEQDVCPYLVDDKACYLLFRTATWAMMTFAPEGANDRALYLTAADELRSALGGALRIPNVYTWSSLHEVRLDSTVVEAPALSYDENGQPTADGTGTQYLPSAMSTPSMAASHTAALTEATPPAAAPPAHAATGCRVMVVGLTAKPQYNGLLGTVVSWDASKSRAGVQLDNGAGAGLLLKPGNLVPGAQTPPVAAANATPGQPSGTPTILWLHGLGDTGAGWSHLPQQLRLASGTRFRFPDAPVQPVTCNGGHAMTSWMDLTTIPVTLAASDDKRGLESSCSAIHRMLDDICADGTPSTDIVLGGFSQGGAMSVLAGYSYAKKLAGVVCLSGWAALEDELVARVRSGANAETPAFIAHGTEDPTVLPECGARTSDLLQEAGVQVTSLLGYKMGHGACPSEMEDLRDWMKGTVGFG